MRPIPRGQLYFDPARTARDAARAMVPPPAPGSVVRRFEEAFAATVGAPWAVALPHARVALRALLDVLALPAESEVLMSPVTIPDIVSVVLMAGLVPVFVDLGERTCNVDCDALARAITSRSRAILVTHLCGIPTEMERVTALAAQHGLIVLEDCSQVPGTRHRGTPLGLFGHAGFLSLTPLKPVSTLHGGMTLTRDASLARELRRAVDRSPAPLPPARLAKLFARDAVLHTVTHPAVFARITWRAVRAGEALRPEVVREFQRGNLFNDPARRRRVTRVDRLPDWMLARYSDAQAALGFRALRSLHDGNARRRDLSLALLERLRAANTPGLLRIPVDPQDCTFWRFPLWIDDPARIPPLRRRLLARGVDTSPTNLECCSREPAFAPWSAHTPEAARFVDAMIFLPMHPTLRDDEVHRIADEVIDALSAR